jgi:hypothetical protein
MKLAVVLGTTFIFAFGNVAEAALLQGVHGGVRVNRGDGYVVVRDATELKSGDMVMVDAKGKARLVYSDGCDVPVKARSVTIISAKSPCSQMAAQYPGPGGSTPPDGDLGFIGWVGGGGALLVGGALAGGIAAASSGGNNSTPSFIPAPLSP